MASWRPQLSPVKSSRASLVRMTLHLRGETGLWLKTRAVEHRQRWFHVVLYRMVQCSAVRGVRVVQAAYRPGRPSSYQSGRRRRRLRASCPWCSQCSARGGRSFRRCGVGDGGVPVVVPKRGLCQWRRRRGGAGGRRAVDGVWGGEGARWRVAGRVQVSSWWSGLAYTLKLASIGGSTAGMPTCGLLRRPG